MGRFITSGLIRATLALSAAAQDWYQQRQEQMRGEEWRLHLLSHMYGRIWLMCGRAWQRTRNSSGLRKRKTN